MRQSNGKPKPAAAAMNSLPLIILLLAVVLFIAADLLLKFDFNWVDYAIVIIIALFGLKGYIKGLINTVFSLAGYLVGLFAAYLFSPKLTLIAMQKTTLGDTITNKLNEIIPAISSIGSFKISEAQSEPALSFINKVPEIEAAVSQNALLKQLMTATNTAAQTGNMYSETVITVNDFIAFTILKVVAFIILFILIKLLIVIVGKILTKVLSTSAILGTANRTAGMAVGFSVGILICYVAFVFAIPMLGSLNIVKVPESYTHSIVLSWFNKFISMIIK
ncbi:MAG: CvpA family protein [Acetivibrionales bacterium]|nr:CvpA family protein [Clostridiaceae bacterium]